MAFDTFERELTVRSKSEPLAMLPFGFSTLNQMPHAYRVAVLAY